MNQGLNSANCYSQDSKRNKKYSLFLNSCETGHATVKDIVKLGYHLMQKNKLHPHFFGNNTLLENAQYLAFFALELPHEYNNDQHLNLNISADQATKIFELYEKRISEKLPVEYLTQEAWYLGHKFYVNENVLVPRSIMSNRFRDFLGNINWENHRVLDLCTGSGCIGISLALLDPNIQVDLVDISEKALEVAAININNHLLSNRVHCIQSDLFENVKQKYDLIITNPPYVSTDEYQKSPAEFKREPKIALESGKDGLDIVHRILHTAKNYLNPEGTVIAEVGVTAAKRLKKHYPNFPFKWFNYRKPTGESSIFSMHCAFLCEAKALTPELLNSKAKNSIFKRWFWASEKQ